MTFLYHRFPKLRPLLDVAYYFYLRLPTVSNNLSLKVDNASKIEENNFVNRNSSFRNYINARRASSFDIAVAVATTGLETAYNNTRSNTLGSPTLASAMLSPMLASHAGKASQNFSEVFIYYTY